MVEHNKIRLASLHDIKLDLGTATYTELEHYTDLVDQRLMACEHDLSLIQEELGKRAVYGEPFPNFDPVA